MQNVGAHVGCVSVVCIVSLVYLTSSLYSINAELLPPINLRQGSLLESHNSWFVALIQASLVEPALVTPVIFNYIIIIPLVKESTRHSDIY